MTKKLTVTIDDTVYEGLELRRLDRWFRDGIDRLSSEDMVAVERAIRSQLAL